MRLKRSSTRLLRAGFAREKSSSTPLSVGVMKRMRLPVVTSASSIAFVAARRLASTSSASASAKSSATGVTPACPAISEKVKASASGATCVRCSSEPAATKQSSTPASSTSITSASSLMPRS